MPKETICVISVHQVVRIVISEIIRVSKAKGRTLIRTGEGSFFTYESLKSIMRDLPLNEFAQVHKGHVVRLDQISSIDAESICIDNIIIPMTSAWRKELKQLLGRLLDRSYNVVFPIKQAT